MRWLAALALAAALGGCDARAPQGDAEASPIALTGRYVADSDTARSVTGNITIERVVVINGPDSDTTSQTFDGTIILSHGE